jgi:hypothetical protein
MPELPALDEDENPELTDFQRRFWWTLPLTIVVAALAMFGHGLGWFDMATQSWIELVLTLPVVLWAGAPFFVRGAQSIVNGGRVVEQHALREAEQRGHGEHEDARPAAKMGCGLREARVAAGRATDLGHAAGLGYGLAADAGAAGGVGTAATSRVTSSR